MFLKQLSTLAALSFILAPACAAEAPQQNAANVQVFEVPKGSRPHDVAPAPDGSIWYTAQRTGALGILDPKTGKIREIPLGPDSAPHGVIQGPDGAAWITDGGQNAIVRYDPKTGKLSSWKLPEDTGYANLNTAAFDGDGNLWFTGQNGIYGRLDPDAGEIRMFKDPDGRGPYGIASTPDGEIYYVSLAGSHLAKIDRKSGAAQIIEPPTADEGTRRVWADSKGDLWVSGWNSGQLSRYSPNTGEWKSWKPSGEKPRVYAVFVDDRDIVWVSDWGSNATLAFDPRTESWARYPGSAPDANVRQILGRQGEIYLPESGLDRIMVVRTDRP
ncbi:MAG TPA: SMP-30/gluconolactonase/LRE family protein [Sphingomicrobium sp.]|nr:SMP-30/gluconolactonase/LRE family protein [Sphingomicrobium sp.]